MSRILTYAGPASGTISGGATPVFPGTLGIWNTTPLPSGTYTLKLTVGSLVAERTVTKP